MVQALKKRLAYKLELSQLEADPSPLIELERKLQQIELVKKADESYNHGLKAYKKSREPALSFLKKQKKIIKLQVLKKRIPHLLLLFSAKRLTPGEWKVN